MSEKYNKNLFKDIKSVYFIKVIFSYLKDEIKLNIIKYNKDLQNIMILNFLIINSLVKNM